MITLTNSEGAQIDVPATISHEGFIDFYCSADARKDADREALAASLAFEDEAGNLHSVLGAAIAHLDPIVLQLGIYDDQDNELTPPVLAPGHHFNLRVGGRLLKVDPDTGRARWEPWALAWVMQGEAVDLGGGVVGWKRNGVTLLSGINSPACRWAG